MSAHDVEVTAEPGPTASRRPRVAVIGGGLTGLATAFHLGDDAEVLVIEAAPEPGGQVRTATFAGAPLDVGADAFLARQPEAEQLVRDLGFGDDDLVEPATGQVHLWVRGRLRPLPTDTVLGAPSSIAALRRSGVLTLPGLLRAAAEPLLPRREVAGDRSVADLIGERFGREVVDTLVEPLLGGVYAGDVDRLSAQATLPPVWQAASAHRSLIRGLAAHRARTAGDDRPVFKTVRGGLGTVVQRLVAALGDRVRCGTRVRRLRRCDDGRWALELVSSTGGAHAQVEEVRVDQVVLAVPAAAAAVLLAEVDADVARELAAIRAASVAVVALSYAPGDATRIPAGSGVLVPRTQGRLVKAVTISSRKWPHQAARSDAFVLRASVGRIDDATALELDDDVLVERVDAEVRALLGFTGAARDGLVQRWTDALPQYDVGHHARLDRVRTALFEDHPGLQLGGASFDGVGLAARARDASRLAHEVRWTAANR